MNDEAVKERCYLVYALAPAGVYAGQANVLFNEYIGDPARGLAVYHDHFIGRHGGIAVFEITTEEEKAKLDDPGPLEDWELTSYPPPTPEPQSGSWRRPSSPCAPTAT